MRRLLCLATASGVVLVALTSAVAARIARASDGPTPVTFAVDAGTLSITTPDSVNLGTVPVGTPTISAALGTTTVSDQRADVSGTWTATVSATAFTTGDGTPAETVPAANVSYAPGDATATSGTGTFAPGAGGALGTAQTAFTGTEETGATSCSWNPTITITLPSALVAGTYVGTITQSVA